VRTVTISRRARGINALLQQARRHNLIIRSPDGHEFILAEVDDFDREIELTRQNKQLMALLDQRAKQTRTVPLKEAKQQLGIA
jgi:hypothetical protein